MSSPPPPNPPTTTAGGGSVFPNPTRPPTLPNPYLQNPHHQHPYHQPATTTAFPPPTQRQQHPQQQAGYSNSRIPQQKSSAAKPQDSNQGVLYPVASSGNRGFLPKPHLNQSTDQNAVAAANSGGFPSRPVTGYLYRPYGVPNSDVSVQNLHHLVRPSAHSQQTLPASSGSMVLPSISKGVLVSANEKDVGSGKGVVKQLFVDLNEKPAEEATVGLSEPLRTDVRSSLDHHVEDCPCKVDMAELEKKDLVIAPSSAADGNSLKDSRDKSGDDAFVIIRDRKVQISEGTSLYAQCRSWLKNGCTEETQPQYVECVKSLPKPLPASLVNPKISKVDDKEQEDEIIEDVENVSSKELLQQHIKQAKKVRARLRDHRLQRIERYKGRLALLLPPVVEQQQKNDSASASASGN